MKNINAERSLNRIIMKTAIVYVSTHHGNTRKLAEAIAANCEVTLIDGIKAQELNLEEYDCIGLASGIAYGKFYPKMLKLMEESLPEGKKVFLLYTCGTKQVGYTNAAAKRVKEKNCEMLGEYGCLGFDTYGPFKLVGGISKGHPDSEELAEAVNFYYRIIKQNEGK